MGIEQVIFDVADALRVPVLVLTLIALALVLIEFGALVGELIRRRSRNRATLEATVAETKTRLLAGDTVGAATAAERIAWSKSMSRALASIVELVPQPDSESRTAKVLADFDYTCIRRLERTRILVRMGPALGLMGTLIPLSPALAGLATGDVETLTDNLRVAFSVTVAGLLIGAMAFAISLIRDRLYGQDFSDAEYLTNGIIGTPVPKTPQPAAAATPATPAASPQPGVTPTPTPQPQPQPGPATAPTTPGTSPGAAPTPPGTQAPGTRPGVTPPPNPNPNPGTAS